MNHRTFMTVLVGVWLTIRPIDAEIVTSDLDVCAPKPTQFTMPIENRQYFPSPRNDSDRELIFGVLLPQQPEKFGPLCALYPTVAAIELAIKNSQQSGGLLEDYSITVAYIDTETSSTLAAFAAFQLYTKRPPGYYRISSSQRKKKKNNCSLPINFTELSSMARCFAFEILPFFTPQNQTRLMLLCWSDWMKW